MRYDGDVQEQMGNLRKKLESGINISLLKMEYIQRHAKDKDFKPLSDADVQRIINKQVEGLFDSLVNKTYVKAVKAKVHRGFIDGTSARANEWNAVYDTVFDNIDVHDEKWYQFYKFSKEEWDEFKVMTTLDLMLLATGAGAGATVARHSVGKMTFNQLLKKGVKRKVIEKAMEKGSRAYAKLMIKELGVKQAAKLGVGAFVVETGVTNLVHSALNSALRNDISLLTDPNKFFKSWGSMAVLMGAGKVVNLGLSVKATPKSFLGKVVQGAAIIAADETIMTGIDIGLMALSDKGLNANEIRLALRNNAVFAVGLRGGGRIAAAPTKASGRVMAKIHKADARRIIAEAERTLGFDVRNPKTIETARFAKDGTLILNGGSIRDFTVAVFAEFPKKARDKITQLAESAAAAPPKKPKGKGGPYRTAPEIPKEATAKEKREIREAEVLSKIDKLQTDLAGVNKFLDEFNIRQSLPETQKWEQLFRLDGDKGVIMSSPDGKLYLFHTEAAKYNFPAQLKQFGESLKALSKLSPAKRAKKLVEILKGIDFTITKDADAQKSFKKADEKIRKLIENPNPASLENLTPRELYKLNRAIVSLKKHELIAKRENSREKARATADFATKAERTLKGTFYNHSAITRAEFHKLIDIENDPFLKRVGLSEIEMAKLRYVIDGLFVKTQAIRYYYNKFRDNSKQLFKMAFGREPFGDIKLAADPTQIAFECFDTRDYIFASKGDPATKASGKAVALPFGSSKINELDGFVVVSRGKASELVLAHEGTHNINKYIFSALDPNFRGYEHETFHPREGASKKEIVAQIQSHLKKQARQYLLIAKDEILAFRKDGSSYKKIRKLLLHHYKSRGYAYWDNYDINFKQQLEKSGLDESMIKPALDSLKQTIDDYYKSLDDAIKSAEKFDDLYLLAITDVKDWKFMAKPEKAAAPPKKPKSKGGPYRTQAKVPKVEADIAAKPAAAAKPEGGVKKYVERTRKKLKERAKAREEEAAKLVEKLPELAKEFPELGYKEMLAKSPHEIKQIVEATTKVRQLRGDIKNIPTENIQSFIKEYNAKNPAKDLKSQEFRLLGTVEKGVIIVNEAGQLQYLKVNKKNSKAILKHVKKLDIIIRGRSYELRREILKRSGGGSMITADVFTYGEFPTQWEAQIKFLSNKKNWLPERRALHEELIRNEADKALQLSDHLNEAHPTLYVLRGNTAAGKTFSLKNDPGFKHAVDTKGKMGKKGEVNGAINPDTLKNQLRVGEASADGKQTMTAYQAHMEGRVLSYKVRDLVLKKNPKASIIFDERFSDASTLPDTIARAAKMGKRVRILDVDSPLETSCHRVLGRDPGGADPVVPFGPVAEGYEEIRANRRAVVKMAETNPVISDYVLNYVVIEGGNYKTYRLFEKKNGKVIKRPTGATERTLFEKALSGKSDTEITRVKESKITKEYLETIDPRVRENLEPYLRKPPITLGEALDLHSRKLNVEDKK